MITAAFPCPCPAFSSKTNKQEKPALSLGCVSQIKVHNTTSSSPNTTCQKWKVGKTHVPFSSLFQPFTHTRTHPHTHTHTHKMDVDSVLQESAQQVEALKQRVNVQRAEVSERVHVSLWHEN